MRRPKNTEWSDWTKLSEDQKTGIGTILRWHERYSDQPEQTSPTFVLADGPGCGKSLQLVVAADEIAGKTGRPSLILTKSRQLADQLDEDRIEARAPESRVQVGVIGQGIPRDTGCLLIDEAHAARGVMDFRKITIPVVYSTANAFASVDDIEFTASAVLRSADPREVSAALGCDPTAHKNRPIPPMQVITPLKAFRDALKSQGVLLQRSLPFYGKSRLHCHEGLHEIRVESLASCARTALESGLTPVVAAPENDLRDLRKLLPDIRVSRCEKELRKRPDSMFCLPVDVISEGLRLHDKEGNAPRAVICSHPFPPSQMIQIERRTSRRNSKSPTHLAVLADPQVDAEGLHRLELGGHFLHFMGLYAPAIHDALVARNQPFVDHDVTASHRLPEHIRVEKSRSRVKEVGHHD